MRCVRRPAPARRGPMWRRNRGRWRKPAHNRWCPKFLGTRFAANSHNAHAQTRILHQLVKEGHEFDDETLSHLSLYITEHVNRFGIYTLNLGRMSPEPDYTLSPQPKPSAAPSVSAF